VPLPAWTSTDPRQEGDPVAPVAVCRSRSARADERRAGQVVGETRPAQDALLGRGSGSAWEQHSPL
jgi:hypothetical protein